MHFYLIRHGETFSNAEGRIQGQTDHPLSPLGERQALATGRSLRAIPVDALFTSPLARARRTAEILGEELHLPLRQEAALMEIHAGVFQELLWEECEVRYPEAAAAWKNEDPDFVIPGGESRRQLIARGTEALNTIKGKEFEHVVVVSHGGLLAAGLKGLLHVPAERNPFRLANCSITQLEWQSDPVVVRMNDVSHLERLHLDAAPGKTGDL